jgi:hypothetical protein
MSKKSGWSRRALLEWAAASSALAAADLACAPADKKPVYGFLTDDEARTVGALADSLWPAGPDGNDGGGALGAAMYIDKLLTALDPLLLSNPRIHAGGPFSGRAPADDGSGTNDDFQDFLPLSRLGEKAWRINLFGSDAVEGGVPNEALLGPVKGLRQGVRDALAAITDASPDFANLAAPARFEAWKALPEAHRELLLDLTLQSVLGAPEYGGNTGTKGWQAIHFPGDSAPRGYTRYDEATQTNVEREDAPSSTLGPDSDLDPIDSDTAALIENVVRALGGRGA